MRESYSLPDPWRKRVHKHLSREGFGPDERPARSCRPSCLSRQRRIRLARQTRRFADECRRNRALAAAAAAFAAASKTDRRADPGIAAAVGYMAARLDLARLL